MSVFEELRKQEQTLRTLEQQMSNPSIVRKSRSEYEKVLKEYDELQVQFKENGGYQFEADIRSVLHGLNFQSFDYNTKISSLSGGQKTRLALGKLLLSKPDILILDEPTNHLDIDTLSWLEQYLQSYDGAILIVSHDRYFLDKVVNQVYEISRHQIMKFPGNYSFYLDKKAENYERDMKLFEKQQDEVAKLQDFIQRNLARASTTKRAQSRRKQLDRMELMDRPLGDESSATFRFDIEKQSGNEVLNIHSLSIGYEKDAAVSTNINLRVTRGESIALVGPNGVGKSTLLKTIVEKLPALDGELQIGTNVFIGYYDQQQADLTSNKTVLKELWDEYPFKNEKDIRTVLGNFLFSGDDVLKIVSSLSGGEKARLALAKLMLQKANFLILDEPTNHLDLDSKEILENALIDYPGTILFVSHDRYFINRIASKVIELNLEGVTDYLGDYDYYVEKKLEQEELKALQQNEQQSAIQSNPSEKTSYQQDKEAKKLERQRQRRIEQIENQIEELEQAVEQNEQLLCDPEVFQDHVKSLEINEENEKYKQELEQLMEEWTLLSEE